MADRLVARCVEPGATVALDLAHHVGQGEGLQVLAHLFAGLGPERQEYALALVVAGPVGVGLAELTRDDRAVDRRDDLGQRDGVGRAGQHVAAADATLGTDQTGTL